MQHCKENTILQRGNCGVSNKCPRFIYHGSHIASCIITAYIVSTMHRAENAQQLCPFAYCILYTHCTHIVHILYICCTHIVHILYIYWAYIVHRMHNSNFPSHIAHISPQMNVFLGIHQKRRKNSYHS